MDAIIQPLPRDRICGEITATMNVGGRGRMFDEGWPGKIKLAAQLKEIAESDVSVAVAAGATTEWRLGVQ